MVVDTDLHTESFVSLEEPHTMNLSILKKYSNYRVRSSQTVLKTPVSNGILGVETLFTTIKINIIMFMGS